MKLKFPILMYIDNELSAYPEEAIKVLTISFPDNKTMLIKETVKKHKKGWVMEVDGKFRELTPAGKRREWARSISFLWNFVLSEYKMGEDRFITIGEFKKIIEKITDRYREAPTAASLRKFLKQYNDSVTVSEEILRKWPI